MIRADMVSSIAAPGLTWLAVSRTHDVEARDADATDSRWSNCRIEVHVSSSFMLAGASVDARPSSHRRDRRRCNGPAPVVEIGVMTPPRQILPGQLCFITVRAVNRCHRFAPTRKALEIIWFCLACTLHKYRGRIELHEFLWMSNHYHVVLTDRGACLPRFMEELDSLLARALNALYGISGTAIEKGYNLVAVEPDAKAIEHCVYTLANPCRAHLVKRSRHWQGVSSLTLDYSVPIMLRRPRHGLWSGACEHLRGKASQGSKRARFGGRTKLPEEIELVLTRPPVMLDLSDAELRRHIRERLDERELALSAERRARRASVMGWRAARRVSIWATPQTEERFGLVPSFSADTSKGRIAAWGRRLEFLEEYYEALARFVDGEHDVAFPEGTWLMRERFKVRCDPLAIAAV